jgi:hypothetical protein
MAQTNLANAATSIDTTYDNIVIVNNSFSIRGGYSLNLTGFTPTIIVAGHPVIEETSTGQLKPMPISGTAFAALPAGHTYVGVTIHTDLAVRPMAGVMTHGVVNHLAFTAAQAAGKDGYYTGYAGIIAAIKTANPLLDFRGDR